MDDLREQFLERLTRALFTSDDGFVLKGGGAIRALYGSQRLTKDVALDFTNPKRTVGSLHRTVLAAVRSAARGLPIQGLHVNEPGLGEKSPRWKINFRDPDNMPVHVEVEVSRDAERVAPGRIVQKSFVPLAARGTARFHVAVYDEPTLIATKIAALLGRQVPRDVFDLDLLQAANDDPSSAQVSWAIARAGLAHQEPKDVLWANLDALGWERFAAELRDALPEHVARRIDDSEWTAMKLRVGEYVERLLAAAQAQS